MKVTGRQAEKNRERVLDVAGRLFREKGVDGIGLDGLMKAPGDRWPRRSVRRVSSALCRTFRSVRSGRVCRTSGDYAVHILGNSPTPPVVHFRRAHSKFYRFNPCRLVATFINEKAAVTQGQAASFFASSNMEGLGAPASRSGVRRSMFDVRRLL